MAACLQRGNTPVLCVTYTGPIPSQAHPTHGAICYQVGCTIPRSQHSSQFYYTPRAPEVKTIIIIKQALQPVTSPIQNASGYKKVLFPR